MIHGEESNDINLIYVGIVLAVFLIFIIWIAYRGVVKNWREKSIYHRKESLQLKADPSLPSLAEVSIKDGSRIRAWLDHDKEEFRRKANRNPRRKKQIKKRLEEEQKKLSSQKLNGEICEIAASQLQGIDFAKKLPHMVGSGRGTGGLLGIPNSETTSYLSNRSFQDSRHSRYLIRRHSSFFGNKASVPPNILMKERERQNSITSQRSLFAAPNYPSNHQDHPQALARLASISSLPVHDIGFHPQRTSSFATIQNNQQIQGQTHQSTTGAPIASSTSGGIQDSSFNDTLSFGPGCDHRIIPGGGVIESSLLEVDEDEVSTPGTSLLVSPSSSGLHNQDVTDSAPLIAAPEVPQNIFTFQNLGAQGRRRTSEAFKDMNTELRNLLESSWDSRQSATGSANSGDDEAEDDEVDFQTGDSDDSVVSHSNKEEAMSPSIPLPSLDIPKSKSANLSVHFEPQLSPSKSSTAIGRSSPRDHSPSDIQKASRKPRNNSLTQLITHVITKPDLRKSHSLSTKAIEKMKLTSSAVSTAIDIDTSTDQGDITNSVSSSELSNDKHIPTDLQNTENIGTNSGVKSQLHPQPTQPGTSSASSKFQVEILNTPPPTLASDETRSNILNTLVVNTERRSSIKSRAKDDVTTTLLGEKDDLMFVTSDEDEEASSPTGHERSTRTLSNTTTDYSDENGDTITSLKMIIALKK
ncbi:uncharacterized protein LOC142339196 isoform X2 [Convolutriloba macropyga]|uniref:uncharacterized protein LOC142339196 isoform X2 n=1 Tax=Convolutriloba macropyga TaxID=536237 RepID=UPI003F521F95